MDATGRHPDTVPASVRCPTCSAPVDVTARLALWADPNAPGGHAAHILIDLDPARAHGCPEALVAALAHFGVPW